MIPITQFFSAIKEIDPRMTKVRIADSLGISRAALNYFIMKADDTFFIEIKNRRLSIIRHEAKHSAGLSEFTKREQVVINALKKR